MKNPFSRKDDQPNIPVEMGNKGPFVSAPVIGYVDENGDIVFDTRLKAELIAKIPGSRAASATRRRKERANASEQTSSESGA